MTVREELEALQAKYNNYYKLNRKHLAYKAVKQALALMRDQIAQLEYQVRKEAPQQ
jgi:hypothetical protein